MSLGYWLTIHFKKVLKQFLWETKKNNQNINCFFSFPIKFFLNGLLTNTLRVFISIFLLKNIL